MGKLLKLSIIAALCGALTSCGPLTRISDVVDGRLDKLEQVCLNRLEKGLDLSRCDRAFNLHDNLRVRWAAFNSSGLDSDRVALSEAVDAFNAAALEAIDE